MELATCLWEKGEYGDAITAFNYAQGSSRYRKKATLRKGQCYIKIDDYESAIGELELLISEVETMTPEKLEAHYELGKVLKCVDREAEGEEQLKIVFDHDPEFKDIKELVSED